MIRDDSSTAILIAGRDSAQDSINRDMVLRPFQPLFFNRGISRQVDALTLIPHMLDAFKTGD